MTDQIAIDTAWNGHVYQFPRELGLNALFAIQVALQPDAVAVDSGSDEMTYAELDSRACQMALWLRDHGVVERTPVGVFMGPCADQIVVQMAICKLGATYVPLDPDYPPGRLQFMVRESAVDVVITTSVQASTTPLPAIPLCIDDQALTIAEYPAFIAELSDEPGSRSHVLYTFGSTGHPKVVELLAGSISRLVLHTTLADIDPTDRIAQVSILSLDGAIFEVWGSLLNGAALVLVPRATVLDPLAMKAVLSQRRVTTMFMTTSLFNVTAHTCPEAFSGLRYVFIGGECASPEAMRAVLQHSRPPQLVHVYGPTECTTFSSGDEVTPELVSGASVPIGRPVSNTSIFFPTGDCSQSESAE